MTVAPHTEVIDPLTDPAWAGLASETSGSLFSSPPWLSAVAATYGFEPRAAVVRDPAGHLLAGQPFCLVSDDLGARVRSFPFSDYCDPLGATSWFPALAARLLEAGTPVMLRVLHDQASRASGLFREAGRAAWHGVDVRPGLAELWSALGGSAVRNINRARRSGVTVRAGTDLADVATFYRLHCALRKAKYRLLPQPFTFFERLHAEFMPRGGLWVLLAEWEGRVVAGTLFLAWGRTVYYKFNASVDATCRPNDLLVWEGICRACEAGFESLDFGLSGLDQPGLVRFKQKYASHEAHITTLVADAPGAPSPDGSLRSLLTDLTALLTDPVVPDEVTARGGDLLYRFFA